MDMARRESMMEYAILIYRNESETDVDWPQREADFATYFKQAAEAGILTPGPRLGRSDTATTVRVRDGQRQVTDGPFIEAREQIGGVFTLQCRDLDDALDWAARCPAAGYGVIEVRPVWAG
jgi:hypothetical protein